MTPEGRIKARINRYLATLHDPLNGLEIYVEMPVPTGFGKSGLDYTMCIFGRFVCIEAKAPGEWLTPRQRLRALSILNSGGHVFIISGDAGLAAFAKWVERCRKGSVVTAAS